MVFHERASWSILKFEEENKDKIDQYISQKLKKGEFLKEVAQHFSHLKESTAQVIRIQEIPFLLIKKNNLKLLGISAINSSNVLTERLRKGNSKQLSFQSEKMKAVMELVRKVSLVDSTVLILGKTGVGKSHIAKLIHQYSQRSNKQLAIVNCSAIPESLIEAELFGYTAGSFTGGHKDGKPGIFQSVSGGTIFLDEIGEVPFHLQSKLLEVIQENSIRPIGSVESIPVDVRIIAATNQDLEDMVKKKLFREDLYYRLNVVPIQIPPLSERKEDLQVLITQFLNTFGDKYEMQKVFTPEVMNAFYQYDWPGNVRELENMIERLFITSEEEVITLNDLPESISNLSNNKNNQESYSPPFLSLKEAKQRAENALISNAYKVYRNTYKVAEVLQVNQSTIARKVKELRERGEL
ncbi:AAA family ATPase [Siminovitchia terrae]|uniref:AAA family ATPase n=1 Tax=Siminovitchia terrae TaxID=1914933 RepID=A0A429X8Q0_SIMTE|nr:sigma 54-interacting transcriptional regulator [Siminovitchia terrae]RST59766.1 AAA family ATPase [Siminovitchia terrae]